MTRHAALPGHRPGTPAPHTGLAGIPNPAWMEHAACRRRNSSGNLFYDPEIFFPTSNSYTHARRVCLACPVADLCLAWAMANEGGVTAWARHGMFGGLTPDQRAELAKEGP